MTKMTHIPPKITKDSNVSSVFNETSDFMRTGQILIQT